ncbi:unnamed protein product [Clonostachys byssicola]|uniref:FAD dependent oxidoreductase domain-containing protein n=1 Tax=Clonostachys byssicola TaxID=160290 RepID=A0A9N9UQB3_9HYPO|nr:unnamed protein product [Clonostachys byssicola]
MTKVTILGAGIIGMAAAAKLPRDYDITIIAEHLPGDYHTKEWASPYAAATWVGVHKSTPREQQMQLEGLAGLRSLAATSPESSVRRIEMKEIMDVGSPEDVWYAGKVPGFRFLEAHELPQGAKYGMVYQTVVLTPQVFLVWMFERLKARGVNFVRTKVQSLGDLENLGHDVLINASGFGAQTLKDVQEKHMISMRMQTVVIKNDTYDRLFIRRGPNGYYSTAFARKDGTVYVGGVLLRDNSDLTVHEDHRAQVCRNAHMNQPEVFPSPDPKEWPILYDHVAKYPIMDGENGKNVRCEREIIGSQKVIHAYGPHAGGYVFSFGLAREIANLMDDFLLKMMPTVKL